MKFTQQEIHSTGDVNLAFTRVGSIAFGYFKSQMSPPGSNLEPGKKNRAILYN